MDKFSSRRQSSDGRKKHFFLHQAIAGYGPLHGSHQGDHQEIVGYGACYGPLQRSHQGDHHEIAGHGAGYGPLQRSHEGDHHEIAGLQSSHQGYRVMIDQ